jgi:hypothetical protein
LTIKLLVKLEKLPYSTFTQHLRVVGLLVFTCGIPDGKVRYLSDGLMWKLVEKNFLVSTLPVVQASKIRR